ncbi:uncharacterized protein [Aegilops tauschii subsp. strangulata]|uniref:uncharacterized protein n=1 Tax=Aegilops tauschii subsp. strangulata TaxID=200361 RepID=UPI003CC8CD44
MASVATEPAGGREGDKMVITPLGGGSEVGRSCVHMTFKGCTVLVSIPSPPNPTPRHRRRPPHHAFSPGPRGLAALLPGEDHFQGPSVHDPRHQGHLQAAALRLRQGQQGVRGGHALRRAGHSQVHGKN